MVMNPYSSANLSSCSIMRVYKIHDTAGEIVFCIGIAMPLPIPRSQRYGSRGPYPAPPPDRLPVRVHRFHKQRRHRGRTHPQRQDERDHRGLRDPVAGCGQPGCKHEQSYRHRDGADAADAVKPANGPTDNNRRKDANSHAHHGVDQQ